MELSEQVDNAQAQAKPVRKRKPRLRPPRAVMISLWTPSGETLSESTVKKFEEAIERVTFELFNDGVRVLTQTNRAA